MMGEKTKKGSTGGKGPKTKKTDKSNWKLKALLKKLGGAAAVQPQQPATSSGTGNAATAENTKSSIPKQSFMPNDTKPVDAKSNGDSNVEVVKWIMRALNSGVPKLREEYRNLAKYVMDNMTTDAFNKNPEKNRYQDVPCQDQNRVILKGGPDDYIHANYVATPNSDKRFICTQGPLETTCSDFWTMVLQEGSTVIIMLCNTIENGKWKCHPYWPENKDKEPLKFQMTNYKTEIVVAFKKQSTLANEPSVKRTVLLVKFTDPESGKPAERVVIHFQWTDWPDRGVPPCKLTAMELLSNVRGTKQPIVVHCSAGIGRTGTIVTIEYIMERLVAHEECAAMDKLLKELRSQRAWSIQNDLQYLYTHRILLYYFLEKHKERYWPIISQSPDGEKNFATFIRDYNAATSTN